MDRVFAGRPPLDPKSERNAGHGKRVQYQSLSARQVELEVGIMRDLFAIAIGIVVAVAVIYVTLDVRGHKQAAQLITQLTHSDVTKSN